MKFNCSPSLKQRKKIFLHTSDTVYLHKPVDSDNQCNIFNRYSYGI